MAKNILANNGLAIIEEKTVPPVSECVCLGIVINTNNFALSIPKAKLNNIINMCKVFSKFKKITKQQIQSILGSLICINKAISPARLFINRIIGLLKISPEQGFIHVGADFQRDLQWFMAFHLYNGFTCFDNIVNVIDYEVYVDASFRGLGWCFNNQVYKLNIDGHGQNIAHWEALNVLLAFCTWANIVASRTIRVHCDNAAAVAIFNTSRGLDLVLHAIARNIWLLAASYDIKLVFQHIRGEDNHVADLLSRLSAMQNPVCKLYSYLNQQPVWWEIDRGFLLLNWTI
jgi:hypothetical protein